MVATYVPLLLLFIVGGILTLLFFIATPLLGKKNPNPEKMLPYECGSETTGGRHVKLSVKFYLTAMLFILFDVEAAFLLPWAVNFKQALWTFAAMLSFMATLLVGFIYAWGKGAFEWER